MTQKSIFLLQSHKFSSDDIEATLVCLKCDEIFKKDFPLDLEGQTIQFKCPVCNATGEADLPYKNIEERVKLEEDFGEIEQSNKKTVKNLTTTFKHPPATDKRIPTDPENILLLMG